MPISSQSGLYLNLQQFSEFKANARRDSPETIKAVAEQFESLFVQQMLGAMRSAATIDESLHSSYIDTYQDMYDKQLSLSLSQQGGLGIARMLVEQMSGRQQIAANRDQDLPVFQLQDTNLELPLKSMNYQAENPAVVVKKLGGSDFVEVEAAGVSVSAINQWTKPAHFVKDIWPHAEQASQALGVSAEIIVAQSALETGWGKYAMLFPDGRPSNNLFGIKAGQGWNGPVLTKSTLEFRDGVMQTEVARFRSYDSISNALSDYVQIIQSNSRYRNALEHQGDDAHFVRGLQQAGYATDPEYANKILDIVHSERFKATLALLPSNQNQRNTGGNLNA